MELQHLVSGQQSTIGIDENLANGSPTGKPNDHVFSNLRKLFDHHKERDQGFKEAMEKNAEMQMELDKYRAAVEYKKDGNFFFREIVLNHFVLTKKSYFRHTWAKKG